MKIDKSCSILKYERVKLTKTRQALIVKNCKFNDFGVYQAQCGQDVCEVVKNWHHHVNCTKFKSFFRKL